jgi:hypothetical protein
MTGNILLLCLANALMLSVGIGLLPVLRLAHSRRDVVARLPLAYAVGLAATGIVAANLAVVDVPVGRLGLPLLAAGSLALGLPRLERGRPRARRSRPPWQLVPTVVLLLPTAAYFANAARLFAVKPLFENDSWALWGTRARALYEFGHPVAPVFTESWYPALQYPLFLPALEAIDFRFFGAVDGTTIHLQELGLAAAFVGAAWTLLRRHSESVLLAAALLAIVTAPMFFRQLQANHADIPVAMLLALGVAVLAAWLRSGERGLLPAATLFLAGGALTKNEGELFVIAAFIAAFAVAQREQRRPLAHALGATVACVAPWHIWLLVHDVTATTFNLSHLLNPDYLTSHWFRVVSAQHQLFAHIQLASNTSRLSLVAAVGFACALLVGSLRLTAFGAAWLVLSFGVLICVYWASSQPLYPDLNFSADRTIDTLLVGGVLLVPVLIGTARRGRDDY